MLDVTAMAEGSETVSASMVLNETINVGVTTNASKKFYLTVFLLFSSNGCR